MGQDKRKVYASGDALLESLSCGIAQFRLYKDGMIYVDRINPEGVRIFAKESGENVRTEVHLRELLSQEDLQRLDEVMKMLMRDNGRITFEYPISVDEDRPIWITGVLQNLGNGEDERGEVAYKQASFMNITPTRRALERAVQSEKRVQMEREQNAEFFYEIFNRLYESSAVVEDMEEVLSFVGKYLDADRVSIYEEREEGHFCDNTYEWCAEGIDSVKDIRQNLPYSREYAQSIVGAKGYSFCPDVRKLPKNDREFLEKDKCCSIFLCGIFDIQKNAIGYISVESCTRIRDEWEEESPEREAVLHAGQLLSNYVNKVRNMEHNEVFRQRLIDTERRVGAQTDAIAALGKAYLVVFQCDLAKNTVELVAGERQGEMPEEQPKEPQGLFNLFIERQVSMLYREEMHTFLDMNTMLERMKNNTMLSHDYQSMSGRWIRASLIYGGDQIVLFAVNNIEDERNAEREYQRQLKEVRRRENIQLKTIMDSIPGGFKIMRDDGHFSIEYMSPRLIEMLGYSVEEQQTVLQMHITAFIHPDDRQSVYEEIIDQIRKNKNMYLKYRMLRKDGSSFWIEDIGHQVKFDDGEIKYYSVILDVDEAERQTIALKNANQTVLRERRQYRDALTRNALYYFHFDVTEGIIAEDVVDINGVNFMEAVGVSAPIGFDEYCQRVLFGDNPLIEVENPEVLTTDYLKKSFEEGQTNVETELRSRIENTFFRLNLLLSKDEVTNHIYAFLLCRDTTETRREEERTKLALKEAYEAASSANQAKTDFLSKMSHDIRTPMNAIIGMTNIAKAHIGDTERVVDCLEKINTSSEHMMGLINEVLDMSRIESGNMVLKEEKFNIRKLLDNMLDMANSEIEQRHHKVSLHMVDVEHETIIGDSLRMEQVFVNILGNALKYTPNGGQIDICVQEKPARQPGIGYYEFSFADNGIGMSEEFQKVLFKPFSREEDDRINKIQGTGLGMAIAKNIIQMMNGDIHVESKEGKGSRFTVRVYLRFVELDDKNKQERTREQKVVRFEDKRILVVEDNALNREIVCEILKLRGLNIEQAENGKEAVEKFESYPAGYYDMILMDVQMPVMNGYEASREIRGLDREDAKTIPIVAMTANAFAEDIQASKDAGMNEHLAKPLDMRKLTDVLVYYFDQ